ncbi:MAG: serine/threonine-protein kinase, partial [Thermoanaerobaculia bacterium]
VVHTNISTNEDAKERFLREARTATRVQHPNVATLHDFAALPDGAHYMVWEFINGENLAQRLRTRGPLPPRQAVHIAIEALRGLDAIHRAGIIHRDISPENLMITADDEVKIIDLGVAKVEDADAVSQTRTGIFVGKLRYASPEQLGFLPEGEKLDARADLYAMAMVLVELLTGRPPYEAKSPHEYFMLHATEPRKQTVSIPRDLPCSEELEEILTKALARDRNTRYPTARHFITALEAIERKLPNPRDMATLAMSLDGDETMRVTPTQPDTLHRETVRTQAPTAATPMPMPPAAATVRTPLPAPVTTTPPPPQLRKGINPVYLVAVIAVLALLVGALLFWPRGERAPLIAYRETTTTPSATTTTAAPASAAQVAATAVTVTSPTTETTATTTTIVPPVLSAPPPITTTTAAPAPIVTPPKPKPVVPTPQPQPQPADPEPSEDNDTPAPIPAGLATYVDGGDDSDANERAVEVLRRELRGTTRMALRAPGNHLEFARIMREYFPDMEFSA